MCVPIGSPLHPPVSRTRGRGREEVRLKQYVCTLAAVQCSNGWWFYTDQLLYIYIYLNLVGGTVRCAGAGAGVGR
jgi:hypothetical protein